MGIRELPNCRDVVSVDLTHFVRFGGATSQPKGTRKRTGILTTFETCSGPRDIVVRPCCAVDAGSCSRLELAHGASGAACRPCDICTHFIKHNFVYVFTSLYIKMTSGRRCLVLAGLADVADKVHTRRCLVLVLTPAAALVLADGAHIAGGVDSRSCLVLVCQAVAADFRPCDIYTHVIAHNCFQVFTSLHIGSSRVCVFDLALMRYCMRDELSHVWIWQKTRTV